MSGKIRKSGKASGDQQQAADVSTPGGQGPGAMPPETMHGNAATMGNAAAMEAIGPGAESAESGLAEHPFLEMAAHAPDPTDDGLSGSGGTLPFSGTIQKSFGRHDISNVIAHTGTEAAEATSALGSLGYTSGESVVLSPGADLHTVAHEVAHAVHQRYGASPSGGVGSPGDKWERNADEVADAVVRGESAEALLDSVIGGPDATPSPSSGVVQHKMEFATHYGSAPEAATAAVKADHKAYAKYQSRFERKLGVGLFKDGRAMEGADAMLDKMSTAMDEAGIDRVDAFTGVKSKKKKSVDLGGLLKNDVNEALQSGNLREKMGMVYQARFKISEAINELTKRDNHDLIDDEMYTPEMQQDILEKQQENKPASYAILKRRDSVQNFGRKGNKGEKIGLITPENLEAQGIGLSDREQHAANKVGATRFKAGREFYKVNKDVKKSEQDKLRRVVAGLSGSTDMYFHIANHLKMSKEDREKLRLATLGQMLTNQDHSYHEIMHVAKTRGGLADYADELPMGYTTLEPLVPDDILQVAGLADFPGDQQIRELGVIDTAEDVKDKADVSKKSHSYPAVLAAIDAYHNQPSRARLEAIIAAVTKFEQDKQPGKRSRKSTKTKYADRMKALGRVRRQAQRMLGQWDALSEVPGNELAALAKETMDGDPDDGLDRMTRLMAMKSEDNDDWYSQDFRAPDAAHQVDTSQVSVSVESQKKIMQIDSDKKLARTMGNKAEDARAEPINADLESDLEGFVQENLTIIGVLKGDIKKKRVTVRDRANNPEQATKQQRLNDEIPRIREQYKDNTQDFTTNIDTKVLEVLGKPAPTDAVGKLLQQMEGQPVPKEMQAIQAYAQPGFYKIMNKVLSKRANKRFMASRKGMKWWAEVPDDVKNLVSLAVSAVRKMKPYDGGPVYRGQGLRGYGTKAIEKELKKNPKAQREATWRGAVGGSKRYNQFVSTSKRPDSSYIVNKGSYLAMHIDNPKSGVDISAFSNTLYEREVLFPPNTTFKVTNVEDKFKTRRPDEQDNRYDDAPLADSTEKGRVKVTLEEA